jgi:hypothetical protein
MNVSNTMCSSPMAAQIYDMAKCKTDEKCNVRRSVRRTENSALLTIGVKCRYIGLHNSSPAPKTFALCNAQNAIDMPTQASPIQSLSQHDINNDAS